MPDPGSSAAANPDYGRFGLARNPFRELDSDTLAAAELRHVAQDLDSTLRGMKEAALERREKAAVLLSGPLGSGKTHRLRVAESEARRLAVACVYLETRSEPRRLAPALAQGLLASAALGRLQRTLRPPSWLARLDRVARGRSMGPEEVGAALGVALEAQAPVFLLLNDLHNLGSGPDSEAALSAFQAVLAQAPKGTLLLASCYPDFRRRLEEGHAALLSRFHRVFEIPLLGHADAARFLAKRMAFARLVEDLDPLYPFDRVSLAALNEAAGQNPRRLLLLADTVLEQAARRRSYHIDADLVRTVLEGSVLAPPVPAPVAAGPGGPSLLDRLRAARRAPAAVPLEAPAGR